MYTVKWIQLFLTVLILFSDYNYLFAQLYCFKYSYLISTIFKEINLTHRLNPNRYYQG